MNRETKSVGLRLTGDLDGRPFTIDLVEGQYTVGLQEDNDIVLPVAGVSRRHALLRVKNGQIGVEDVGSKNGVWINGIRIRNTTVHPGEWIGFGPVALYVVEIDREDAELAIAVERRRTAARLPRTTKDKDEDTDTRSRRQEDEPPCWISLLNNLADNLIGGRDPDPHAALAALRSELGASGACFFEWAEKEEPLAIATSGEHFELGGAEGLSAALSAIAEVGKMEPVVLSGKVDGGHELTWAAGSGPGKRVSAIVLKGGFPHRTIVGPLLETTLRMLLSSKIEPVSPDCCGPRTPSPQLVFPEGHVVGDSPAMQEVYNQLCQLLKGNIPVLITGETGVGKELMASLLHRSSDRRGGPFVAVNCAAIPSDLLEAELFGIERGVATGVDARKGKFQLAEGGVLFLDEIADMSPDLQAKLLRALQEMEITPLGSRCPIGVDVRIVSATNTDPRKRLADGKFRRDLFFRLAGFVLDIPPLRERREDISPLVEHFMRRYAIEIDKSIRGITVKALNALVAAPWPGNIRELEQEVRRLVYVCPEGQAIDSHLLSESVLYPEPEVLSQLDKHADLDLELRTAELERKLITVALARTRGNRTRAAKLLGISRNGLAMKMKRLGLI